MRFRCLTLMTSQNGHEVTIQVSNLRFVLVISTQFSNIFLTVLMMLTILYI
jgi:hypothetical protein